MKQMFEGCSSLKYLNISSFAFSGRNLNMSSMFSGCSSLVELDIKNFDTSTNAYKNNIFKGISKNIILCTKNNDLSRLIQYYENKKEGFGEIEILGSVFNNNKAGIGGALYLKNVNINIGGKLYGLNDDQCFVGSPLRILI